MEPIKKIESEKDNQDPLQAKIRSEIEGQNSLVEDQLELMTPTKGR